MREVEHIAGVFQHDMTQACLRCGVLLSDYRNTMWPEGTPPPRGWEEGIAVYAYANVMSTMPPTDGNYDSCVTRS